MKSKRRLSMDDVFSQKSHVVAPSAYFETLDLRKHSIYKERAFPLPYACPTPPPKQTSGLAVGSQARLIAAARRSANAGHPINTLLTARWHALLIYDEFHPLRAMQTPERIRHTVELLRKWLTRRGIPVKYIWMREISEKAGEHWHLALHLPSSEHEAFVAYVERIFIEPLASPPRSWPSQTRGEFARSEHGSWHLAGEVTDGKPQFEGYWLAAYLGKGEHSQRVFRGQLENNTQKPVRGQKFGGRVRSDRYDEPQGDIRGTATRKGRFDMARSLK
jgi:hypothetical protein